MDNILETRDRVIEVAVDLFSRKGFNGTSIRAIAHAMGMSISNIYHYFGNKEGLMVAILEQSAKRLLESLRKVSEGKVEHVARFELLVKAHLRQADEFRKESKIFFIDEDHLSPEGKAMNRRLQREILNIYLNELRTLKALGYLGSRNLTVTAFNILGVINWHLHWYRPGGPMSMDDVSKEIVSFVMYGLLGPVPRTEAFHSSNVQISDEK